LNVYWLLAVVVEDLLLVFSDTAVAVAVDRL
jgi:hypothetical protein